MTGTSINGNSSGLDSADGGRIITFGDNRLRDNDADGSFTGSEAKQ
ncbi:MAG: hypothetical protein IPK97_10850 [Ahniella sp.]|nr:hypothetical protein [Ahniella sp.]